MNTFLFTADYNADMQRHIDDLYTAAKTLLTSRQERLQASDDLVEAYVEHAGKRPDSMALGRLATLILREELTDMNPDKVTNTEYPFLSDEQYSRRRDGKHKRKNGGMQGEASMKGAFAVATDGRNYRIPTRRERSDLENAHMDEHTIPWKRDERGDVIVD